MLGKIDPHDAPMAKNLVDSFCQKYASSEYENMMVITNDGEVHVMTDHNPKGVDCSYLGDKLKGSYNIHTHPPDSTQFFSAQMWICRTSLQDGSAVMDETCKRLHIAAYTRRKL